ncbi:MAG: hypothetical protein POELPBGB_00552 [Bacteroidia bacterium]|nr:hypothetical protein [Bacteroidia bacterium]
MGARTLSSPVGFSTNKDYKKYFIIEYFVGLGMQKVRRNVE